MTTSSTTNKFRYEGNGVTDTFAFTGRIFNTSDIKVNIITRATDALVETLTETTHYTVTINGDESAEVVVVASKIPSASQDIQLLRVLPKTQTLDLPTGTRFPAESVEDALDKSISIIQDLSEVVDRSIKLSEQSSLEDVELPAPEASKLIGWNVAANNLANYELADLSLTINTAFSGLANNDMMIYNGTNWVNQPFTSNIDIDALTAMSAAPVATTDYIAMYDDSAGTTLKILPSDFYETINTLTADATPNPAADYVVTYDASATAAKKVLLNDILDNVSAQEPLSGASLTAVTVAANDKVLIQDTGDSDNLKTVTAQSIADLASVGLVLVDTASGASPTLTLDGSIENYQIRIKRLTMTSANKKIRMHLSRSSTNQTFTWINSPKYALSTTTATSANLEFTPNANNSEMTGVIDLVNIGGTIPFKTYTADLRGDFTHYIASGYKIDANAYDEISFSLDTGSITASYIELWGYSG